MLITSYLTPLIKHTPSLMDCECLTGQHTRKITEVYERSDTSECLSVSAMSRSSAGHCGHSIFLRNVFRPQVLWKLNKVIIEPKAFMSYWFLGYMFSSKSLSDIIAVVEEKKCLRKVDRLFAFQTMFSNVSHHSCSILLYWTLST